MKNRTTSNSAQSCVLLAVT